MNVITLIKKALSPIFDRGSGHYAGSVVREPFGGAWQRNQELRGPDELILFPYIFSAITLIAQDIAKMPLKLMQQTPEKLWEEVENPAFSPVIRKPNGYQSRQQMIESAMISALVHGNFYLLKLKDKRGIVKELRVLDPTRVTVLTSDDGQVFYRCATDTLAGISSDEVTIPASAIVHFRINCLFHPLVGVSPIRAATMAAGLGWNIQANASSFFLNSSRPGGILTAVGAISDETAKAIKDSWTANYSGSSVGKIAILADGLTYSPVEMIPAADAQMLEMLGWTGTTVCSVFHIPPFKLGLADVKYDQVESLSTIYYSDCLQALVEQLESVLTEGLNLPKNLAIEADLDTLLRMDLAAQVRTLSDAVGGGLLTIDEARRALNKPAVPGGSVIFRQEQEWPIEQLANRRHGPDDAVNDNDEKGIELIRKIQELGYAA